MIEINWDSKLKFIRIITIGESAIICNLDLYSLVKHLANEESRPHW